MPVLQTARAVWLWWFSRPLLMAAIACTAGLWAGLRAGETASGGTLISAMTIYLAGVVCFAVGLCIRRQYRYALILAVFLLAMIYGYLSGRLNGPDWPVRTEGSVQEISGWVTAAPAIDGNRLKFRMLAAIGSDPSLDGNSRSAVAYQDTDHKLDPVLVSVRLKSEAERSRAKLLRTGDQVRLQGTVNRFPEARNFGGFDVRKWAARQPLYWMVQGDFERLATVGYPNTTERLINYPWKGKPFAAVQMLWQRPVDEWRAIVTAAFRSTFRQVPELAALLISMQLGDRDELTWTEEDTFTRYGLAHVLAISGSNVAIWVAAVYLLLRPFPVTEERLAIIACMSVPFYVVMTGAESSVIRAGIMAMLMLWAKSRRESVDPLHVLAGCAMLMLMIRPYWLFDIGFQLSVLVTAGILILISFPRMRQSFHPVWLIPLMAQWLTLPHAAFLFHQTSSISLLLNIAIVPLFGMILIPFSAVAVAASSVLPDGWITPFTAILYATFLLVRQSFDWAGQLEPFPLTVPEPDEPLIWFCLYLMLTLKGFYWIRSIGTPALVSADDRDMHPEVADSIRAVSRPAGSASAAQVAEDPFQPSVFSGVLRWGVWVLTLILFSLVTFRPEPFQQLWAAISGTDRTLIRFFDVGQGDAALIRFPDGYTLLIDTGPAAFQYGDWRDRRKPFDTGRDVLLPLLRKQGVHRLDALVITHADLDHIGGAASLLDGMPVSEIWYNGVPADKEAYRAMISAAEKHRVPLRALAAGQKLPVGVDARIEVWSPARIDRSVSPAVADQNALSVVLHILVRGHSFVFTGDMPVEGEREILSGALTMPAGAAVLKAGHHGSHTSTSEEWLSTLRPALTVFSAGVNNRYRHPHPQVIGRTAASGSAIHRTDRQGELQIRFEHGKIVTRAKFVPVEANDFAERDRNK